MTSATPPSSTELTGRVLFAHGRGDLPKLEIKTPWSAAEVYLHGAHLTHYQKRGEEPILFLSGQSRFDKSSAIRGGIPVIFPWFGPRAGASAHGYARTQSWEAREIICRPGGEIRLCLTLPQALTADSALVNYWITVGRELTLELQVSNQSTGRDFTFEDCLHTYFAIGDIGAVSLTGLEGTAYLDKTDAFARKTDSPGPLKIWAETDRVYLDTTSATEIHDMKLKRKIRIEKSDSRSTVVWNPWAAKSAQLPDMGPDEFRQMFCVESGNVGENQIKLSPGQSATLEVRISSMAI